MTSARIEGARVRFTGRSGRQLGCYVVAVSIEAHLTVSYSQQADASLRAWLASHAMKLTVVELSHGVCPRQSMITGWWACSTQDAIAQAHAVRAALGRLEIAVSRIKLESPYSNADQLTPALYIEHHVKVCTASERFVELGKIAVNQNAHLSRTSHRRVGQVEERFLTQRFAARSTSLADASLATLLDSLRMASMTVLKVERERVVYDDNLSLDAGWVQELL